MMLEDLAYHAYDRLMRNGGITVDMQGVEPTEGYAYSPYPELERALPQAAVTPQVIAQYLDDNQRALSMPGNFLGAWLDTQSGNVFLDISHVGPPTPDTIADAKKQKQIALFDLANAQEIPTGVTYEEKHGAVDHQAVLNQNMGQNLQGLPGPVNVPGYGPLQFHSNADIQRIANEYNQANGLGAHPADYTRVNPQTSAQIAQEYERMPHAPNDPNVAQAYDALARETRAQYDHAVNNGYRFEFYPQHDPYPNSPREAVLDLHHNKHMYVYPTETGYGMDENSQDHPLLGDSGVRWNGRPVTHNDLFRAIHDFYGHAKEGVGFRADGEDNAWRQHAAMFSDPARRALTSETRGQNSWVNFGPHAEHNQTATSDTIYAPQKAGLMPDWTMDPELHRVAKTAAWEPFTQWREEPPEFEFPRKFMTDNDDHNRSLLAGYVIEPHEPHEWQWTSKVDPDWMRQWIATNGPYLAHYTQPEVYPLIHQRGLLPHDTEGIGSLYHGELTPRANHVYLRYPYSHQPNPRQASPIYVDLRKLDWDRINADEDNFIEGGPGVHGVTPMYDEARNQEYTHVEDFEGGKYHHYGHWADTIGLNEPHHTAHSLNGSTVAVQGGINPEAFAHPDEVKAYMEANHPNNIHRSPFDDRARLKLQEVPFQPSTQMAFSRHSAWKYDQLDQYPIPDWQPGEERRAIVGQDGRAYQGAPHDTHANIARGYGVTPRSYHWIDGNGSVVMDGYNDADPADAHLVANLHPQWHIDPKSQQSWDDVWGNSTQQGQSLSYTREGSTRLNSTIGGLGMWRFALNHPLPGARCYFHPDRPAVANAGFANMCQQCTDQYQHAQIGTAPDMRSVPHQLAKTAIWELPEGYGLLHGPQYPEENKLVAEPGRMEGYEDCPQCHAWTKMPLGGCPHCGFNKDEWSERWSAFWNREPKPFMNGTMTKDQWHNELGYRRFNDIMEAGRYHNADPTSLYLGEHDYERPELRNRLTVQPQFFPSGDPQKTYWDAQRFQPEELSQWHQRYQDEARQRYMNDPSSPYFDYENWIDWYGTHHPEHLGHRTADMVIGDEEDVTNVIGQAEYDRWQFSDDAQGEWNAQDVIEWVNDSR